MTFQTSIGTALALSLLVALPSIVAAEESRVPCSDPRLSVDETLDGAWRDSARVLCERLAVMKDVDPSARVHLRRVEDGVEVGVTLGEGRSAVRRLRNPDDLPAVVEALTAVIPTAPVEPVRSEPAHPEPMRPEPPKESAPAVPAATATIQPEPSSTLTVEIGAGLEGRMSGTPLYLSVGGNVYAGIRPGEWLFALTARWQPSEVPAKRSNEEFELESAGAGFIVARRIVRGGLVSMDAGASVLVLVDTQSIESRVPDEVGSAMDARFGVLLKALIGRGALRFAPSIDMDVAPARLGRSIYIDPELPPLPTWSIGLGLGVSWVEQ